MKKNFDDIYSLTLPLPFSTTPKLNIYYIDGTEPVLIDSGLGDLQSIELISSKLKKIGKTINNISTIVNTHEHIEHFGGDRKLREISGASVAASTIAGPIIENSQKINRNLKNYLKHFEPELADELNYSIDYDLKIEESKVDTLLEDRDIIDTGSVRLRVIYTPGHTLGHICLYSEERKALFTGDHIISKGSTFVGYDYREIATQRIVDVFNVKYMEPDNLSLYIESLQKLQSLDLEVILPSHGDPVTDPYKKLEQEIKKKDRRSHIFLKVLKGTNEMSLKNLTAKVYGNNSKSLIHCGSALGYLARLNKSGIIEAKMKRDDLYLRMKTLPL
ncbi:MAG: MBL fold metallo-hydrolase [Spirochaetes bacterium]|nr:MBL fold metallo-hydrolase [Spirochaetota bacterium]